MDRQRYYVSVQGKSILANQGDAAYEFEVDATAEERDRLQELFEALEECEHKTVFRTAVQPGMPYHHDSENDDYDDCLNEIYNFLHDIGTEETVRHLDAMRLDPEPETPSETW